METYSPETMWQAVAASDPTYDGHFCYGVTTTRVFCRPSCKSRQPRRENTVFFPGPAAALAQGYRPCKRCRPDALLAPGQDLIRIARLLLETEYDNPAILTELPGRIGLSRSHLARLFKHHTGQAPRDYLRALRIGKAEALLAGSHLTGTGVAYAVGFGSPSRFFAAFRARTGLSPRAWRRCQTEEAAPCSK
ncbi:bifunctional transcriptional activator/DNA repair enzyme AdaA [Anaeroselena agilis]|uniref:Ada metal-binding domain-containing protein n=1 Tax=Anaeroselena agilis TaxID=3063788 RepID=A0ABU3P1E4_9FIRM|nr:Ada metal-binding domain-containing protein [Selenomonadales bacterium 4137-cl]